MPQLNVDGSLLKILRSSKSVSQYQSNGRSLCQVHLIVLSYHLITGPMYACVLAVYIHKEVQHKTPFDVAAKYTPTASFY